MVRITNKIGEYTMPINKKSKDNTTKSEPIRKPLPQSSIIGKRREIFNLNTIKGNKRKNS